jgi:hypothetical protein
MNWKGLLSAIFIAAVFALVCLPAEKVSAQGKYGNRFSATIQMVITGDTTAFRQRTSHFGIIDPIGVLPRELIGIKLFVPTDMINYPVFIAPLDGGEIFGTESLFVASDSTATFSFKAGNTPGRYRVQVIIASQQYLLQLYVPHNVPDNCVPP